MFFTCITIKLIWFNEFYDVRRLGSYARKGKEAKREKRRRSAKTGRGGNLLIEISIRIRQNNLNLRVEQLVRLHYADTRHNTVLSSVYIRRM